MTANLRSPTLRWPLLAAGLAAVKLGWLAIDATPMLFLGDSESYLATAQSGWIPPDRSFLYGLLLQPLALAPGTLVPLLIAQSAAGVVSALLLAYVLVNVLAQPPRAAIAAALAWAALEPLALLYERYVMTEAFALAAFAGFVAFALRYVEGRRLPDLVAAHAAATCVIALRTMFVPVAWAVTLLLPCVAWLRPAGGEDVRASRRGLIFALAVSLASTAALHQGYKAIHASVGGRSAYSQADGLFLLAAWAPILVAEDFRDPALGARVLGSSACRQADRFDREAQRWYAGCLVDVLTREAGDAQRANDLARAAALRALRRDPSGFAALAFATWRDGLDPAQVRRAMQYDRGDRAYAPATVALLRDRLGVEQAAELHNTPTATKRLHAAAMPWVVLLSLAPFAAVAALVVAAPSRRRPLVLITLLAACMIGASAVGSTGAVPRYLQPIAWLAVIPLAVLASRGTARRQKSAREDAPNAR